MQRPKIIGLSKIIGLFVLGRVEVRPAFRQAVDDVVRENEELLKELAR